MWKDTENHDLYQGDIAGVEDWEDLTAVAQLGRRWPGGIVPYRISLEFNYAQRSLILEAMAHWENKTCIKFVERSGDFDENFLYIHNNRITPGCWAQIGYLSHKRPNLLSLHPSGCFYLGTVLHELGHAIGFYHEHTRYDRDLYLDILWDNIEANHHTQFYIPTPHDMQLLDSFDYDSIMMYGDNAFSTDGSKKTMVSKDGRPLRPIIDKKTLTDADIRRANQLYEC
ncbi:nas-4 [Cordylochernes scorpioides]|uniref:Metalloendopeptidase n=1 Tax=Cordylochernes scorpioides TaxID=51811 RepID=A0ABY6K092_9ARAC|nr:nas-4 [Cordylochernes scorpioides]